MTMMPPGSVSITLNCDKESYAYGENIIAGYSITNNLSRSIYIVKDLQYVSPQSGNSIEIGFAIPESDNEKSLSYYQFMQPSLEEISPNEIKFGNVIIRMPLLNTIITTNDELVFGDANVVGDVFVYLVLGFGLDILFSKKGNPLKAFLKWQNLVESDKVKINIRDKGSGRSTQDTDNHRPGYPPSENIVYDYVPQQQQQASSFG